MTLESDLLKRVKDCPPGSSGWREFENACLALLEYLFVPPLNRPKVQVKTVSGLNRFDAIFPNRESSTSGGWKQLLHELKARLVLIEFKNYEKKRIGKKEVEQACNYLTRRMGNLAILCCNKAPCKSAYKSRNTIFNDKEKVVLFLTPDQLSEMCDIKGRGEDPADLIVDLLEYFYITNE
jgi:hypothetical protein